MTDGPPSDIFLPTILTPNFDGANDELIFSDQDGWDIWGGELTVFDRWGQIVFESSDYTEPWWSGTRDGSQLPAGVYYYIFRLEGEEYRESLTILR